MSILSAAPPTSPPASQGLTYPVGLWSLWTPASCRSIQCRTVPARQPTRPGDMRKGGGKCPARTIRQSVTTLTPTVSATSRRESTRQASRDSFSMTAVWHDAGWNFGRSFRPGKIFHTSQPGRPVQVPPSRSRTTYPRLASAFGLGAPPAIHEFVTATLYTSRVTETTSTTMPLGTGRPWRVRHVRPVFGQGDVGKTRVRPTRSAAGSGHNRRPCVCPHLESMSSYAGAGRGVPGALRRGTAFSG